MSISVGPDAVTSARKHVVAPVGLSKIEHARRIERIDRDIQIMRDFEIAARIARALAHDSRNDI